MLKITDALSQSYGDMLENYDNEHFNIYDLPEEIKAQLPDLQDAPVGELFHTKVRRVEVHGLNLDEECKKDFARGKGIRLMSPDSYDKKNNKIYDGLQSTFFGSDYGDDNAFSECWSCSCGKYVGKMYAHQICEECGSEVEYSEVDLEKFGWVIIDGHKVINPLYYAKLDRLLGVMDGKERVLDGIIKVVREDDERRKRDKLESYDFKEKMKYDSNPFYRKGMMWLNDNIDDVLAYYKKKRSKKFESSFNELYSNMDKIFTSSIPIYSSVLRLETPGLKGEKFYKVKVNSIMGSIIKTANKVNEYYETIYDSDIIEVNKFLHQIQSDYNELFEEEFKTINSKNGIIQAKVISGRFNYTARTIIKAGSGTLHADEIVVPYIVFLDLFKLEIMNLLKKLKNITYAEAQTIFQLAHVHFNHDIYNIMLYLIHDPKCRGIAHVLINRNPSINHGSYVYVRIAHITPNIEDKTLTINTRIIKTMNADFDGDQINIYRIYGLDMMKAYAKNLNPRNKFYISSINGRINPDMMPMKNECVGFFQFNNFALTKNTNIY